jgi:hypothetical protein
LNLEGASLAESVRLETYVVLQRGGKDSAVLAARRPGSILWRDTTTLVLEGRATRFPTELCDFDEHGWLPTEAGWYLDWDPVDLHRTAMGGVRLLVNSRHTHVRRAIEGNHPDGSARAIRAAIHHDVGRVLITGCLTSDEFVANPRAFDEGSIGQAVHRLLVALFDGETVKSLATRFRTEPWRFECELQDRLRVFQDL